MIELDMFIEVLVGIFVVGGVIVSFFTMQKGQTMKLAQLQKDVDKDKAEFQRQIDKDNIEFQRQIDKDSTEVHKKMDKDLTAFQSQINEQKKEHSILAMSHVECEKAIVKIYSSLDHILEAIDDLKHSINSLKGIK